MRVLADADVADLLSLSELLPIIETAFLKQGRGEVVRPDRPHFPLGQGLDGAEPTATGLTMPAYVHGAPYVATKLVTVHEDNPARGLPTVHAQLALADADTGEAVAFLDAVRLTNARTACIGGLAARELSNGGRVGVLGAGTQARWQVRAIDAATGVDSVRIYAPSDSRDRCAADLRGNGIDATAVGTPEAAVGDVDVVVTATTSTEPVFPADALSPGTLVVGIGAYTAEMRELPPELFDRAARVFADVPEEVAEIGDLQDIGVTEADLVPLSDVFEGRAGREAEAEILVVDSVGTAVLDAAAGEFVYDRAVESGAGTEIPF
jgi:alanine dehydrogenase